MSDTNSRHSSLSNLENTATNKPTAIPRCAVTVNWNSTLRAAALSVRFVTADESLTNLIQQEQQSRCPPSVNLEYSSTLNAPLPQSSFAWPSSSTTTAFDPAYRYISAAEVGTYFPPHCSQQQQHQLVTNASTSATWHQQNNVDFLPYQPAHHEAANASSSSHASTTLNTPSPTDTVILINFQDLDGDQQQHAAHSSNFFGEKILSNPVFTARTFAVQHIDFINIIKIAWLQLDINALKRCSHDYWLQVSHVYRGTKLLEWMPLRSLLVDMDVKLYKLLVDAMVPVPEADNAYRALSDRDFANMHSFLTTALYNAPQAYQPLPMVLQVPLACALVAFCRTALDRLELVFSVKTGLQILENDSCDISAVVEQLILATDKNTLHDGNANDDDDDDVTSGGIVAGSSGSSSRRTQAILQQYVDLSQQQQHQERHRRDEQQSSRRMSGTSIETFSSVAASLSSSSKRKSYTTPTNEYPPLITSRARQLILQQLRQLLHTTMLPETLVDGVFAACESIITGLMATFHPIDYHQAVAGGGVDQQKLFAYLGSMPLILQAVVNSLMKEAAAIAASTISIALPQLRTLFDMLCMAVRFMCDSTHEQMQQIDNPIVSNFVANLLDQKRVMHQLGLVDFHEQNENCRIADEEVSDRQCSTSENRRAVHTSDDSATPVSTTNAAHASLTPARGATNLSAVAPRATDEFNVLPTSLYRLRHGNTATDYNQTGTTPAYYTPNLQYVEPPDEILPEFATLSSVPTQIIMVTDGSIDGLVCMEEMTRSGGGGTSNYAKLVPPAAADFASTNLSHHNQTVTGDNGATVAEVCSSTNQEQQQQTKLHATMPEPTAIPTFSNCKRRQQQRARHYAGSSSFTHEYIETQQNQLPGGCITDIMCAEEGVDDSGAFGFSRLENRNFTTQVSTTINCAASAPSTTVFSHAPLVSVNSRQHARQKRASLSSSPLQTPKKTAKMQHSPTVDSLKPVYWGGDNYCDIDREVDDDDDDDDDEEGNLLHVADHCFGPSGSGNFISVNTLDIDGSLDIFTEKRR